MKFQLKVLFRKTVHEEKKHVFQKPTMTVIEGTHEIIATGTQTQNNLDRSLDMRHGYSGMY